MKVLLQRGLLLVCLSLTLAVRAEIGLNHQSLPGISIHSEMRTNPPTRLFVAVVDLKDPRLRLRVAAGGPDPDGPGKWQTTLMTPTKIAARERFDLVINGDFFKALGVNDAEGTNSAYRSSQWALVEGPAATAGKTWATNSSARPCLVIHRDRRVTIETLSSPAAGDWEVIAGNTILLHEGRVVPHRNTVRHPRTVVGLNAAGDRLTILVVDGRKPGVAIGMSYDELAAEMLRLGCVEALNLDGGGSSVMAIRAPGKKEMTILNQPTDGRERAVANVLGITVEP